MKQVTIDTVKARIAEMENIQNTTTIGISLREEFELACLRQLLGAMDCEPVATLDVQSRRPDGNKFALVFSSAAHKLPDDVYFLYRHAQPAARREQVRADHAEWSQATFGGVGPIGPLKHLSIEALEAAEAPGDLSEWADLQFLLWDAQRRAGITDEQITQAMIDKLAVNKARTWPEPKDGEPRLHVKAENDNTAQQFEALATSTQPEIIGYEHRMICGELRRVPKFAGQDIEATSAVHSRVSGWSERQQKVISYSLWRFMHSAYEMAANAAQKGTKEDFDRFMQEAKDAEEIRAEFTSARSGKP